MILRWGAALRGLISLIVEIFVVLSSSVSPGRGLLRACLSCSLPAFIFGCCRVLSPSVTDCVPSAVLGWSCEGYPLRPVRCPLPRRSVWTYVVFDGYSCLARTAATAPRWMIVILVREAGAGAAQPGGSSSSRRRSPPVASTSRWCASYDDGCGGAPNSGRRVRPCP